MPDPIPDPLTTHLDEVRKRAALTKPSAHGYTPRGEQLPGGPADDWLIANLEAAADVAPLLAAVERLLKLAGEWDAKGTEIWGQIELQDCDGASAGFKAIGAEAHRRSARDVRETISRALLGEGDAS